MSLHLFNYREIIPSNYISVLPNDFKITRSTRYDILILRMLSSTLELNFIKNSTKINIKSNYLVYPKHHVNRKSSKPIRSFLLPFTINDYIRYSNKYYGRNINFYHNILQELSFYFYYSKKENHQSAFVNLYRILEFISYSFPLIHSSHFGNFSGSFDALKSYFLDNKTSEITFFERFINNIFRGTSYLSFTTTFDFSQADSVIALNCYKSIHDLMKPTDWTSADRPNFKLEIENAHLVKLFKNIRNRYFHFAIGGQRNLYNTDLKDPDFLFERLNDNFLNWFGFIYATVIKENLDNSLL